MKDGIKSIAIGLFFLLIWNLFSQSNTSSNNININSNAPIPQPKLFPYQGHEFDWNKIKEHDASIIKFYASWCGFCRRELPYLSELKELNIAPMFGIVSGDSEKNVIKLFKKYKNPYTYIGLDPQKKAMHQFKVRGLPTTIIVDRDMNIRYFRTGALDKYVIHKEIIPAINKIKKKYNQNEKDIK